MISVPGPYCCWRREATSYIQVMVPLYSAAGRILAAPHSSRLASRRFTQQRTALSQVVSDVREDQHCGYNVPEITKDNIVGRFVKGDSA